MIRGYNVDRCPFCGAPQAYLHIRKSVQNIQVMCGKCGAEGPSSQTEEDAIERWNKRRSHGRKVTKMVKPAKIVDGIIGELRGYDKVPPPKFVWLRIANELHTAFEQYKKGE